MDNLFLTQGLNPTSEAFETLIHSAQCRIERIVSFGQTTPEGQWYDQDEHEWVVLLSGSAELSFADGSRQPMRPGDHLNIPAHTRHRVESTSATEPSVWLAVFYR